MYLPLRKVVREAWKSLTSTYAALGHKYLQAYLNEYTVRRHLRLQPKKTAMCRKLLQMCMTTPALCYRQLIAAHPNPPLSIAA
ncbi:hypothetical protein YV30_24230 [Salmonella enterica subsp. enterica]|nr:hypothetical protein [Salmonella enterica subsp. enterica]